MNRTRRDLLGDESIAACVLRVLVFALPAVGLDCAVLFVPRDVTVVFGAGSSVSVASDTASIRGVGDGEGDEFASKSGMSDLLLLLPPRLRTGVTASASVIC